MGLVGFENDMLSNHSFSRSVFTRDEELLGNTKATDRLDLIYAPLHGFRNEVCLFEVEKDCHPNNCPVLVQTMLKGVRKVYAKRG